MTQRFREKSKGEKLFWVESGKKGGRKGGMGEQNDGNNTQQPNYSPSTRHLGKTPVLWQP